MSVGNSSGIYAEKDVAAFASSAQSDSAQSKYGIGKFFSGVEFKDDKLVKTILDISGLLEDPKVLDKTKQELYSKVEGWVGVGKSQGWVGDDYKPKTGMWAQMRGIAEKYEDLLARNLDEVYKNVMFEIKRQKP